MQASCRWIAREVHGRRDWFNISAKSALMPLPRLILFLALGFRCVAAPAAVTCEQLASIALTAQQLRDQGHSLQTVLAEADKLESSKKFTADELERIKGVVETAFKSIRSPLEVLQECKDKLPR
jgi:hypothetical protein